MRQTAPGIAVFFCFTFSFTVLSTIAHAQTLTVLHAFTGGADGAGPLSGVTVAGPGSLYGTTSGGGTNGYGVVFKLTQRTSGWTLSPLYEFKAGSDASGPLAPVTVGPNGALYGAALGGDSNKGTVYALQPPPTACKTAICYWNETLLHSFQGGADDGANPYFGNLVFDRAGNLYGTTQLGGAGQLCSGGCGTVFALSPSAGGWAFSLIHSFNNLGVDGFNPQYGLVFDSAGNLYGTTPAGGGHSGGVVYELTPSGGSWTEDVLYDFEGTPVPTTLAVDPSGNLYGSTSAENSGVFELTNSDGNWIFSTLYSFANNCGTQPLARDTAGNLYGTCDIGGLYDYGWVFKLANSDGSWTINDLHDFTGGTDGGDPFGPVVLDGSGNLYGTTMVGGNLADCQGFTDGCGVVWEITP